jgi:hypothetical protein
MPNFRRDFSAVSQLNLRQNQFNENYHDYPDVDLSGDHLHNRLCRGKAKLQKDAQKLPDERQEGMPLRQGLRLLVT